MEESVYEELECIFHNIFLIEEDLEYEKCLDRIKFLVSKIPSDDCIFSNEILIFTHCLSKFLYKDTARKMSSKTNFTHALRVAELIYVCDIGINPIIAGYLHDVVEDTVYGEYLLRALFPKEAIDLVMFNTENKKLSWEERKSHTISQIKKGDNTEGIFLILSDKLANLEELNNSLPINWEEFNAPEEKQFWYFYSCITESINNFENYPFTNEYVTLVKNIFFKN